MTNIACNLKVIQENIERACEKANRKPEEITMVGVTKTIDTARIQELLNLGITNLGENRVQELLPKYDAINGNVNWHLIGHLQTNKVKLVVPRVTLIHSVDSIKLAEEINKCAKQLNKTVDILVEINIASEKSKHGLSLQDVDMFMENTVYLPNIMVKGFMCIAPNVEKSEENRIYFVKMRKLFIDNRHKSVNNRDIHILSMGMTNDYQIAIEEGANMIRIGTGLFS